MQTATDNINHLNGIIMANKVSTSIVLFKKRAKNNGTFPAKLRVTYNRNLPQLFQDKGQRHPSPDYRPVLYVR